MSQTNLNVESFCMRPSPPPQNATCTAHRRDGLRCKGAPIRGATVCRLHGGSAPQVRDAARKRILAAADPVAARLIEIALNVGTETQHAIAAITKYSIGPASLGLLDLSPPMRGQAAKCFGRSLWKSIGGDASPPRTMAATLIS